MKDNNFGAPSQVSSFGLLDVNDSFADIIEYRDYCLLITLSTDFISCHFYMFL